MKHTVKQLEHLKEELKRITKEAQKGALSYHDAADQIIEVRAEMDRLIEELKNKAKDNK